MLTQAQPTRHSRLGDRLRVTVRARRAISDLARSHGRQHLVLTWPAGVALLPAGVHRPSGHEAIVGHIAQCPIYVDLRQVALWPQRRVLLDVSRAGRSWRGARPCFVLVDLDRCATQLARPA